MTRADLAAAAVRCRHVDQPAREQSRGTMDRARARSFEQRRDSAGHGVHDPGAPLLHRRQIELDPAHANTVYRKFRFGTQIQFG
jgi:hypothetical protein